jgi:antigen flippase
MVYFFHENGVVPSLVAIAATTIGTSWWYSRKVKIQTPRMKFADLWEESSALLKLGVAFMSSGLVAMGVAYAVRVFVLRTAGYAAAGYYQAAWTLGGLYVGVILQAMGADFYPRLTAVAHDHQECNRLVNEQAFVGLLLAGPGIVASLTFAPLVISLFYSAGFSASVGILRWICLGAALQVLTWPMGFIIMAKGRAGLLVFCEVAWGLVSLGLAWACLKMFGLNGAGMAFFGSYAFHVILIYPIVRQLSGFRWSPANRQMCLLYGSLIAVVFGGFYVLPVFWAYLVGSSAAILCGLYSLRVLCKIIPAHEIPTPVRKLMVKVGFTLVGGESLDDAVPAGKSSGE